MPETLEEMIMQKPLAKRVRKGMPEPIRGTGMTYKIGWSILRILNVVQQVDYRLYGAERLDQISGNKIIISNHWSSDYYNLMDHTYNPFFRSGTQTVAWVKSKYYKDRNLADRAIAFFLKAVGQIPVVNKTDIIYDDFRDRMGQSLDRDVYEQVRSNVDDPSQTEGPAAEYFNRYSEELPEVPYSEYLGTYVELMMDMTLKATKEAFENSKRVIIYVGGLRDKRMSKVVMNGAAKAAHLFDATIVARGINGVQDSYEGLNPVPKKGAVIVDIIGSVVPKDELRDIPMDYNPFRREHPEAHDPEAYERIFTEVSYRGKRYINRLLRLPFMSEDAAPVNAFKEGRSLVPPGRS
ncbi:hypothetical protein GF351_05595 [Candidatus Woesearchaeota archaeon]|nr:hypothetical protein [Candidatus Woesearchaeota archaeon]